MNQNLQVLQINFKYFLKQMAHLQSYADQMGGFDFTLTQRYIPRHSEIKSFKIRKPSKPSLIKKLEPLS